MRVSGARESGGRGNGDNCTWKIILKYSKFILNKSPNMYAKCIYKKENSSIICNFEKTGIISMPNSSMKHRLNKS